MNETLLALILWINQNSAFDYDPELGLPQLEQVDQRALVIRLFKDKLPANLSERQLDALENSVMALYAHDLRTIVVGDRVDLASLQGRVVLVHELVHFMQYELGHDREAPCQQVLERDAYQIQHTYMRAHGLTPEEDPFTLAIRSSCSEHY
jgi:hypothetical protein